MVRRLRYFSARRYHIRITVPQERQPDQGLATETVQSRCRGYSPSLLACNFRLVDGHNCAEGEENGVRGPGKKLRFALPAPTAFAPPSSGPPVKSRLVCSF